MGSLGFSRGVRGGRWEKGVKGARESLCRDAIEKERKEVGDLVRGDERKETILSLYDFFPYCTFLERLLCTRHHGL